MKRRFNTHYDGYAGEHIGRKTLASTATHVEAVNTGGTSQHHFKSRFVQDNQHGLEYFKRVVKNLSGAKGKEMQRLVDAILATEKNHEPNKVHCFSDEDLYSVLITNPICKNACVKRKLGNWPEIMAAID